MLEKNNATFDIKDVNGTKRYTLSYDDLGNPDDPCPIFCVHGVLLTRKILDPIAQELVYKFLENKL